MPDQATDRTAKAQEPRVRALPASQPAVRFRAWWDDGNPYDAETESGLWHEWRAARKQDDEAARADEELAKERGQ